MDQTISYLFSYKPADCDQMTETNASAINQTPIQRISTNIFEKLLSKSKHEKETFQSVRIYFENAKNSCSQFTFKFPLQNAEEVQQFAKTIQIKAQEAHRFVPDIACSQFIEPRPLGFARRIEIKDGGPIIQEHVLVDQIFNSVIFIEENVLLPTGENLPGSFAALNSLIEENGSWYFSGVYLYRNSFSAKQIKEKEEMFQKTFENMISFIQSTDVDLIHSNLMKY